MADPRYPYTYACDYIRQFGGYGEGGTNLSRSDAAQIRKAVAKAIGMGDEELARKLADYSQRPDRFRLLDKTTQRVIFELGLTNTQEG